MSSEHPSFVVTHAWAMFKSSIEVFPIIYLFLKINRALGSSKMSSVSPPSV